jgi:7-cyano-7-deazaguanine synthase
MCSVHGLVLDRSATEIEQHEAVCDFVALVCAGSCRGRDSWGIVNDKGEQWLALGESTAAEVQIWMLYSKWLVANCRAEPTTEFVTDKGDTDIQPFSNGAGTWVAHNGTVANDLALAERLGVTVTTRVDSGVLPHLFADVDLSNAPAVTDRLSWIVGSYAMLIGRDDAVLAAANFRPLRLLQQRGGTLVTSLTPEQAGWSFYDRLSGDWLRLEPYHHVTLTSGSCSPPTPIQQDTAERTLIVCSGGMDSTVVAAQQVAEHGAENVDLLHFQYGCAAEEKELVAVQAIAERLGTGLLVVPLGTLFTELAVSTLTSGTEFAEGEAGAEFAHEWVPARNLVLLAVATAIAEGNGYANIALGINIEEAGAYPDNEQEFVYLLNQVMPYAVGPDRRVRLHMPVGHLTKREIVAAGLTVNAPLDLTWSCYGNGDLHCGHCGPCYMRRTAFLINNATDMIGYLQ